MSIPDLIGYSIRIRFLRFGGGLQNEAVKRESN
jgi:hypothetical protein